MVVVVGENVLHHVRREGELSGQWKRPGWICLSLRGNVQGEISYTRWWCQSVFLFVCSFVYLTPETLRLRPPPPVSHVSPLPRCFAPPPVELPPVENSPAWKVTLPWNLCFWRGLLIDNRILNSRLNTIWEFPLGNVLNFHRTKMADTSKDGLLLGGGIHHITTTSVFTHGN